MIVSGPSLLSLKGVGQKTADSLKKLHIHYLQDLLFHLPFRYEDRTKITSIADSQPGDRILIEGEVQGVSIMGRRKRQMVCRIGDDTGSMMLRFFHFNADQLKRLQADNLKLRCFGEVREGMHGQLEMAHPEYQTINNITEKLALNDRLTPIYPTTQGVGQNLLRRLIKEALYWLESNALSELLPESIRKHYQLIDIQTALRYVHEPPVDADQSMLQEGVHPMQQRLAFEELLAHQLSLHRLRHKNKSHGAYALCRAGALKKKLLAQLPFTLTQAQQRVVCEIEDDLKQPHPMMRLVQGDVGSGKTVVAALAILHAIEAGHQAVLMAPTEILAEQHWQNFKVWFKPLGIDVGLLIGSHTAKTRKPLLEGLAVGTCQLVIGTHALFQKDVVFKQLALLVIDEQHRFGVQQRMALNEKGQNGLVSPHQLIMTATPIPRTLSMTVYADLDCSAIDELPPGRQPIQTVLISSSKRDQIISRVKAHCQSGQQAYWVCTLIDESEVLECQAAAKIAEDLQHFMPEIKVGLIHGRLSANEKKQVMQDFKAKQIDLLVGTTVIEVGVDVPNSSLMIIENPERLGLSQLHQLRGRVGRGSLASFCVLLYKAPLSMQAQQRLSIMRDSQDGFKIAEEDLKLRGPGEVLGQRQSGLMRFKVADLLRDQLLVEQVRSVGQQLSKNYPESIDAIVNRWLSHQFAYLSA